MGYKAKTINVEKAEKHLNDMVFESFTKENYEKQKIEKYYEGYRKGINVAIDMFYCCNYEVKEGEKQENG